MKKLLFTVGVVSVLLMGTVVAAKNTNKKATDTYKVATVNLIRLSNELPAAKITEKQLENQLKGIQAAFTKTRKEFSEKMQKLSADTVSMTKSQIEKRVKEAEKLSAEYEAVALKFQTQMNDIIKPEREKFTALTEQLINTVAKEKGYDLVVNVSSTLYKNKDKSDPVDITDEVISKDKSK